MINPLNIIKNNMDKNKIIPITRAHSGTSYFMCFASRFFEYSKNLILEFAKFETENLLYTLLIGKKTIIL